MPNLDKEQEVRVIVLFARSRIQKVLKDYEGFGEVRYNARPKKRAQK